jgi:hydrocephalus-inducing protein
MTTPVRIDKKTEESRPHLGTLFFALPDGTALLFTLQGTALPPRAIPLPAREVPSKVWYTEVISVPNWLKRSQRFRIVINKTKADAATVIKVFRLDCDPSLSPTRTILSFPV